MKRMRNDAINQNGGAALLQFSTRFRAPKRAIRFRIARSMTLIAQAALIQYPPGETLVEDFCQYRNATSKPPSANKPNEFGSGTEEAEN